MSDEGLNNKIGEGENISNDFQVKQEESIKLSKNSKGYNYEVRILSLDVKKLKQITNEIEKEYNIKNVDPM